MRVVTFNRPEAEDYRPREEYEVCISVTDPDTHRAGLSVDFRYILRLSFADLDWYYWARLEKLGRDPDHRVEPITDEQAEEVARFIRKHADADAIICHCEAGVSRSVGIARAVEELIHDATPRESFEKHYVGNEYVRRKVLRAAGEDVPDPTSQPLSKQFKEEA